jgi:phosphoribosylformylglycinamidine cyclo-ligase
VGELLSAFPGEVSSLSHITGGGIAANLSRILPETVSLDIDRSTWKPQAVFRVLAEIAKLKLTELEGTWNLGIGFAMVVRKSSAAAIIAKSKSQGIPAWQVGVVEAAVGANADYVTEAKGVRGGAVRLVGSYAQ